MPIEFRNDLSPEQVREILDYDHVTGLLRWKIKKVGTIAGSLTREGYVCVRFNRRYFQGHRLAWVHHYGYWPEHQIDHKDGDRSNNAIANLREASHAENCRNRRRARGFHPTGFGKFYAMISKNRVHHYLGTFDTAEEARAAYLAATVKHFGEFGVGSAG